MDSSQASASRRWRQNNRERANYLVKRSTARGFIRNYATKDDIKELENLINIRKKEI